MLTRVVAMAAQIELLVNAVVRLKEGLPERLSRADTTSHIRYTFSEWLTNTCRCCGWGWCRKLIGPEQISQLGEWCWVYKHEFCIKCNHTLITPTTHNTIIITNIIFHNNYFVFYKFTLYIQYNVCVCSFTCCSIRSAKRKHPSNAPPCAAHFP